MPKFNLDDAVAKISAPWTPVDVAAVNGNALRIALFEGEYHEHTHEYDELFLVYRGAITIWTESGTINLAEGEGYTVPAGTNHKPIANEPAYVLFIDALEE